MTSDYMIYVTISTNTCSKLKTISDKSTRAETCQTILLVISRFLSLSLPLSLSYSFLCNFAQMWNLFEKSMSLIEKWAYFNWLIWAYFHWFAFGTQFWLFSKVMCCWNWYVRFLQFNYYNNWNLKIKVTVLKINM